MGHLHGLVLPRSSKWRRVVGLIESGASAERIAQASAEAAETALKRAAGDPVFAESAWLLANLPLAARGPGYVHSLSELGVAVEEAPSLFQLAAAVSATLDARARADGGRTDLGEMAQQSLVESLTSAIEPQLPSLFTPEPAEVRRALGRLSGGDRFAALARDFFARLTHRTLDYFLSREMANHVGQSRRFSTDAERRAFDEALAAHCQEAARIVEDYAGGWYGKNVWRGGALSRDATARFAAYAFRKIRHELGRRRDAA